MAQGGAFLKVQPEGPPSGGCKGRSTATIPRHGESPPPPEESSPRPGTGSKAVIGLDLCPFAKAVHVRDQIRYVVSDAETPEELLDDSWASFRLWWRRILTRSKPRC